MPRREGFLGMGAPPTLTCLLLPILLFSGLSGGEELEGELNQAEVQVDVVSGNGITLQCRFDPALSQKKSSLYWIRSNRRNHDTAAIGETAFDQDYSIEQSRLEGRYDLAISDADYDRDNGKFECRIKEDGTGVELFTQTVALTVLLPPGQPTIVKSGTEAVEGQEYSLTCSSLGGSPPPSITWVRKGEGQPLAAELAPALDREGETVSVLTIVPSKEGETVSVLTIVP